MKYYDKIKDYITNNKNFREIKDYITNNKYFNEIKLFIIKKRYIFITISVLLLFAIILVYIKNNTFNNIVIEANFKKIEELIDNKENFIIYYYNSKSSNRYNKKVKKILNQKDINYYIYNDKKVTKEEYNNFLNLLGIDEKLFSTPSLIYIRDGNMYSNLININNINSLNRYIEDYDLVTIK
jgi:hypothetical protein